MAEVRIGRIAYEKFSESSEETSQSRIQRENRQAPEQVMTGNHKNNNIQVLYTLGIVECVLAGLMAILAIITICFNATLPEMGDVHFDFTYSAQGLWGGILVAGTGILGILSKKYPSVRMYNANMAMSIVTASLQPVVIILSVFAVPSRTWANVVTHLVIECLSFAAMVVCIIHSIHCCIGNCCGKRKHQDDVSRIQEVHHHAPAAVMTGNHKNNYVQALYILGIVECVLAGLMKILAITTLCLNATLPRMGHVSFDFTHSAQGLWGGIPVAVTGILGILAKKYPSVRMYNENMGMSFVTAVVQPAVIILSGIAATRNLQPHTSMLTIFFIHIFIENLSFAAMVICIIHSIYCCIGNCGGKREHQVVVSYVPQQSQQFEELSNAHYRVDNGNPASRQQDLTSMAIASSNPTAIASNPTLSE